MRKAPRRQALRPRETPLARASLQSQSLVDLLTDPRDEPRRHLLGEAARAKGVAPLSIRQLLQPLARPAHVVGSDRAQQFLMASLVAERHASVRRAADEGFVLERLDIAARRIEAAGRAERRPQILHDVPAPRAFARFAFDLEHLVAWILEIGAVENHHQREQAVLRARAHERARLPFPLADRLQRRGFRTDASAAELL